MKRLFRWIISIIKFTLSQVVARCVSRDHNRKVESGEKVNTLNVHRVRNVTMHEEVAYDKQSDKQQTRRGGKRKRHSSQRK